MNRFIKKNLFLVGVLGLSALGIVILLVLSVMQYIEMSKYISKTAEMRQTNETLMRQRPPAVAANIALVQKDIDGFHAAANELKGYFGQPLMPAVKAFADELNAAARMALANELRRIDSNFKALEAKVKANPAAKAEMAAYLKAKFEDNRGRFDDEKAKASGSLKKAYERAENYYFMVKNPQTPETLHRKMREFWEREKATEGPREQMYRKFRAEGGEHRENERKFWTVEMWDAALEKFIPEAQKSTIEVIDERNLEEIFLSGLGLLRNMGKQQLRLEAFAREMQNKVVNMLASRNDFSMLGVYFEAKNVPEVPTNKAFVDLSGPRREAEKSSSVTQSSGAAGEGEAKVTAEPADVIRHWEIVADLAKRLLAAKVNSLEQLSYSNMTGRDANNCKFYTYTLGVGGSEKSIRELLNRLSAAYKENRVYVVRRFSMKKQEDQIQDIIDVAQGILSDKTEEASKLAVSGDSMNPGEGEKKVIVAPPTYFKEEGKYPECVAGRSDKCYATIILDYVVYSGNILK